MLPRFVINMGRGVKQTIELRDQFGNLVNAPVKGQTALINFIAFAFAAPLLQIFQFRGGQLPSRYMESGFVMI